MDISALTTIRGNYDLLRCTDNISFASVLDVGVGRGGASLFFASRGKRVTAIGTSLDSYGYPRGLFAKAGLAPVEVRFEDFSSPDGFDAIWMSHVLEHVMDFGLFLDKAHALLRERGWLFVMVPPYKPRVVGGHVNIGWNLGQLMYVLLLKGFDIRAGHFVSHGYNICGFVQKSSTPLPVVRMAGGDLEALADFWPIPVRQGFNGNMVSVNWFDGFVASPDPIESLPFEVPDVGSGAVSRSAERSAG